MLRSIPLLDQAAIDSYEWEYIPLLVDGVPRLAITTATVTFDHSHAQTSVTHYGMVMQRN